MKKKLFSFAALFLVGTLLSFTLPGSWAIGDNYSIAFSTTAASGVFEKFSGSIVFDEKAPEASKFDVTIDVASINTGIGMQNRHARGDDWFDAEKYPTIRFQSKKIVRAGAGYSVTGNLQMHGITRELTFPFTFKGGPSGGAFNGAFTINRNEFKIGDPGGLVGENIKLTVSVPVIRK